MTLCRPAEPVTIDIPIDSHVGFVLACVRGSLARDGSEIPPDPKAIDWPATIAYGSAHGVLPIVYEQVRRTTERAGTDHLPEVLRTRYVRNASRNLILAQTLLEISRSLAAGKVRSLAYKGLVLSQVAHGSIAMREFSDLDIVIAADDVDRASAILSECGFRYVGKRQVPLEVERRFYYDLSFVRGDVHLELHWQLTPQRLGYSPDFEDLWRRSQFVPLSGSAGVQALSTEDHCLLLCVHAAKHGWPRLAWVGDLAGLIRGAPDFDAMAVVQRARAHHVERMLRLGLRLVLELCAVPLPAPFQEFLPSDATAERLAIEVRQRLLFSSQSELSWSESLRFQVASRERLRDRIRVYAHTGGGWPTAKDEPIPRWLQVWLTVALAMTPAVYDWQRVPLPRSLWGLYHAIRPLRVLFTSVRRRFVRR